MKSNSEITRSTYDKIAGAWTERNFGSKKMTREINTFAAYVKKGGKVLDAGCGPGRHTEKLLAKGYKVIGIDFSRAMINEAKRRVPEGEFLIVDMTKMRFAKNSFDGIWCFAAMLHVDKEKCRKLLLDFRKILKPGAILAVSVKEGKGQGIVVDESEFGKHDKRFFAYYTERELVGLLSSSGFKVVEIRHRHRTYNWISAFAKAIK